MSNQGPILESLTESSFSEKAFLFFSFLFFSFLFVLLFFLFLLFKPSFPFLSSPLPLLLLSFSLLFDSKVTDEGRSPTLTTLMGAKVIGGDCTPVLTIGFSSTKERFIMFFRQSFMREG
ncbi:MAG: hypothetical protein DRJ11_11315 [Candidatus Aminicenantes bacterium]|nr:MAG: hypothetical protein DRJ11_11315 [Candidatus Aminicenantes bacterium]